MAAVSVAAIVTLAPIVIEGFTEILKHFNQHGSMPETVNVENARITTTAQGFLDEIMGADSVAPAVDEPGDGS